MYYSLQAVSCDMQNILSFTVQSQWAEQRDEVKKYLAQTKDRKAGKGVMVSIFA